MMKLNGIYQLLVYVDNLNLLGHNTFIDTITKITETLVGATKEVGLHSVSRFC
jgi:hypothetical protein